ncbi:hypothetical protein BC938DRAFT_478513 [Jimgerdemannia flammicorona]|uniref:F-box domain-containing protein n=1 Tax=Jimgerdemannia flammicorona TaxID=994334 RepID=A0A433QMR9_9FUNG|nr:hypothetical protein BC938DRAFT_478513 [Jimgerdemannia flammicorona]
MNDKIPEDIWLSILAFLPIPSLFQFAATSSSMRTFVLTAFCLWATLDLRESAWPIDDDDDDDCYYGDIVPLPCALAKLNRILPSSTKHAVRSILLDGMSVDCQLLRQILLTFPQVEALSLRSCQKLTLNQLIFVLNNFTNSHNYPPSLHRLRVAGLPIDRRPGDLSDVGRFTRLKFLLGYSTNPTVSLDITICSSCKNFITPTTNYPCSVCSKCVEPLCSRCEEKRVCATCDLRLCAICNDRGAMVRRDCGLDEDLKDFHEQDGLTEVQCRECAMLWKCSACRRVGCERCEEMGVIFKQEGSDIMLCDVCWSMRE